MFVDCFKRLFGYRGAADEQQQQTRPFGIIQNKSRAGARAVDYF